METHTSRSWARLTAVAIGAALFGALIVMSTTAFATDPPGGSSVATTTSTLEAAPSGSSPSQPTCTDAPAPFANFNGCNLANRYFEGGDFSGATFVGADLSGATFASATLDHTDFTGANLTTTTFSNVHFTSVNFSGTHIDPSLVRDSTGDGLSIGLPLWSVPRDITATTSGSQVDLSAQIHGAGHLTATALGTRCTIPLNGDGFTRMPTHVTNCPLGVQWGLDSIFGKDREIDLLSVLNLSDGPATGTLSLVVHDGFGRSRSVELHLTMLTASSAKQLSPGEYLVNE